MGTWPTRGWRRCTGRSPAARCRLFLSLVGNQEILEPVYIAAEDSSAELAAVDEAMANLETQHATGAVYRGEAGAARFAAMMTRLEERRDRLAAQPSTPARTEYRATGRTFADRWHEEDDAGRRQLMELRSRAANLRFMASKATRPERLAALEAELARVEAERQQLRGIRRYNEVVSFALDEDLARRAGLAAAGKPVELPDISHAWDRAMAPLRELFGGAGQADASAAPPARLTPTPDTTAQTGLVVPVQPA